MAMLSPTPYCVIVVSKLVGQLSCRSPWRDFHLAVPLRQHLPALGRRVRLLEATGRDGGHVGRSTRVGRLVEAWVDEVAARGELPQVTLHAAVVPHGAPHVKVD